MFEVTATLQKRPLLVFFTLSCTAVNRVRAGRGRVSKTRKITNMASWIINLAK